MKYKPLVTDAALEQAAQALTDAYYADQIAKRGLKPGASLYTLRGQPYARARPLRYADPVKLAGDVGGVLPVDDKAATYDVLEARGAVDVTSLPQRYRDVLEARARTAAAPAGGSTAMRATVAAGHATVAGTGVATALTMAGFGPGVVAAGGALAAVAAGVVGFFTSAEET